MDGIIVKALVAAAVIVSCETLGTEEGCFRQCSLGPVEDSSTCLSHSCWKTSSVQTECKIYSTSLSSTNVTSDHCVLLKDVAGLPLFCQHVLQERGVKVPANMFISTTVPNINTTRAGENIEADNGTDTLCLTWPILAAVGCGGFLLGCLATWFVMTLWKKRANGHKTDNSQPTVAASRERQGTAHTQNRPAGVTSTAHRHLLSSVSIDSGMSSTHVVSPQNMASPSSPGGFNSSNTSGRLSMPDNGGLAGVEPYGMGYNQHPGAARLETIYSPISEGSSRDYQSIKANSEHIYSPSSEGGSSVYTNPPGHRVTIVRGDEIYQPCSEGSSNDYHCVSDRGDELSIYYASTDCYNKDYASLTDDRHTADYSDLNEQSAAKEHARIALSKRTIPATPTGNRKNLPRPQDGNFSFHVNDLAMPREGIPTSDVMESIVTETKNTNPYETIDMFQAKDTPSSTVDTLGKSVTADETGSIIKSDGTAESFVVSGTSTHNLLADCDFVNSEANDLPECDVFDPSGTHKHEYFILEPEPRCICPH